MLCTLLADCILFINNTCSEIKLRFNTRTSPRLVQPFALRFCFNNIKEKESFQGSDIDIDIFLSLGPFPNTKVSLEVGASI